MIAQLFIKPTNKGKIQLFRYFFVGGAAFVVDFGLLWLLTEWGLSYLLSAAFSFVAGLTMNYALSVRWVFRDHTLHSHIIEFVFFAAIGVVGLGMNEAIMWMATELAGLYYLGSKLISTAVVFFWNFTARKYLLFYGKSKKRVVIIGAGPAGLTAAWELCRRSDTEVIVIEQDNTVGGISRTVRYKGNCMDLGGHRYFSKSDTVTKWWQELMPMADEAAQNAVDNNDVMLLRNRLSRIYFLRRFFDYPISLSWQTMRNLGLRRLVRIGLSYVRIRLFPIREERSLEDFYINRFGRELYETFFRDYTQKLWGVECSAISPEWGNQRVKGLSIGAALAHMARRIVRHTDPKKVQTSLIDRFLYPKFGSGHIWEVAAKRISKAGGKILLDSRVTTIHVEQNRVLDITIIDKQGCERQIKCDWLISSMPVRELIAAIDGLVPSEVQKVADGLIYRDFMTVGLLLERMKITGQNGKSYPPDTWIYIQERDVKAGRIQVFNNWSPYMIQDRSKVWIGVEYFVNENDECWMMSDKNFIAMAVSEMEHIGMIDRADLLDAVVIRVPKAYPAYFGTYNRIEEIRKWTDSIENIFLVGRNGMHRYNNIDHSMLTAMAAVDNILTGCTSKSNIWQVNVEQEYHESK